MDYLFIGASCHRATKKSFKNEVKEDIYKILYTYRIKGGKCKGFVKIKSSLAICYVDICSIWLTVAQSNRVCNIFNFAVLDFLWIPIFIYFIELAKCGNCCKLLQWKSVLER
jgi:hypothetical protein